MTEITVSKSSTHQSPIEQWKWYKQGPSKPNVSGSDYNNDLIGYLCMMIKSYAISVKERGHAFSIENITGGTL